MSSATFVRPQDADLAAMAKRISGPLTPDGAEAWYRNDCAWLLQEVSLMRSEMADAREWLLADAGADAPGDDATLQELASWWQQHATGIWEKAQVKKLKADLSDAHKRLVELDAMLVSQQSQMAAVEHAIVDAQETHDAELAAMRADKKLLADELGRLMQRMVEIDDAADTVRAELAAERAAAERNSQMSEALMGERFSKVRELLNQAITLL